MEELKNCDINNEKIILGYVVPPGFQSHILLTNLSRLILYSTWYLKVLNLT